MKGTMQKVFGRLARPSTTAPISKSAKVAMPQPQKLTPSIQGAPKPDSSVGPMVLQYGNPNEETTSETDSIVMDPGSESLLEFGSARNTTERQDSLLVTLQVQNQAGGRSATLAPVGRTELHQGSTYPRPSGNSQVDSVHGSMRSMSDEPSTSSHATQVIAEIVEASGVSNARPAHDPPIVSYDAIDESSSTTSRSLGTRRIPFTNLDKPLPKLPVDDSPIAADEIRPYIVHKDELSVYGNHDPPSDYVVETNSQHGKVELGASSESIMASGEIGFIKEDLGRASRDQDTNNWKDKGRADSADRSHVSTALALTNLNLDDADSLISSTFPPDEHPLRRQHDDEMSVHPASHSRRHPPILTCATSDKGNYSLPMVRPVRHSGRSHSPEATQTVTQPSVDERIRAWVSSLNPPPPRDTSSVIVQVPPFDPTPTTSASELTTSYSRQHHSRGVHTDQPGDSSYRPVAVPASSRALVRTMGVQHAAIEPQSLRKHVQPTRHGPTAVPPSSSRLLDHRAIAQADAYRAEGERLNIDRHPHQDYAADGGRKGGRWRIRR
ncbi:hypothetical protein FRB94_014242 [Tulasnella sp. JGI-2019a]|nr:hypothetical protein FRB93_005409 [Tulasnella sp. JGI-2019a]KAG9014149.1 hypothetical protein FRB94_014242 [Tulasnella sp. JGI-2019a]